MEQRVSAGHPVVQNHGVDDLIGVAVIQDHHLPSTIYITHNLHTQTYSIAMTHGFFRVLQGSLKSKGSFY